MTDNSAAAVDPEHVARVLEYAAHLLPAQGPIGVFVHHNTLHSLEHLPFEEAVLEASRIYGTEPYMRESAYHDAIRNGRISTSDIEFVTSCEPDALLLAGRFARRQLIRALLLTEPREFDARTLDWHLHESDLLLRCRDDIGAAVKDRVIDGGVQLAAKRGLAIPRSSTARERLALSILFSACYEGCAPDSPPRAGLPLRPRDALLSARGIDLDEIIHPLLIRLCEVFLDQGLSYWSMPERHKGFYLSVRSLFGQRGTLLTRHLSGLDEEFARQATERFDAESAVIDALVSLGIASDELPGFLQAELLALPGWAGLMHRLEENPTLAPHECVPASLADFVAVRLTMTKVAVANICKSGEWRHAVPAAASAETLRLLTALRLFEACQIAGISAIDVAGLPDDEFALLRREVERLGGVQRRGLLHLAYERGHERLVLPALARHRQTSPPARQTPRPRAQVFFCIDEREESLRRHLEEIAPDIETFGAAGFFGVAVDYAGIDDAHGSALCPVVVKPKHAVRELPIDEDESLLETRKLRRALWGRFLRNWSVSSRTLVRGWFSTALLGVLSLVPLVSRVLAPWRYARLREWLNSSFLPQPRTELTLMREGREAHDVTEEMLVGFAPEEKVDRIASVLGPAGLREGFARLVVILGHGSSSLNNPHESAHDCGACGGRRGGPNARLFAAMANRPHVREALAERGISIPDDTWFIGAYHDTCNDGIDLYDLESLPDTHSGQLAQLRADLDRARALNAHERSRRFEAAGSDPDVEAALRHVEERSEHLAEPRPEYGHCTNAVAFVGRRAVTRGLFLDRRAFLVSYDASQDRRNDDLAALLAAAVPVCAGISLEYYFSFVDNERYGCGTKLPHNVTGLVGVMNGHASDLRTGLPWQMVSIHEPVRILMVVETTPERLWSVVQRSPSLHRLVTNRWMRISTLDPETGTVHVYRDGAFRPLDIECDELPEAGSSREWYRGHIGHLPIARITPEAAEVRS